jgi:hypothetical protein
MAYSNHPLLLLLAALLLLPGGSLAQPSASPTRSRTPSNTRTPSSSPIPSATPSPYPTIVAPTAPASPLAAHPRLVLTPSRVTELRALLFPSPNETATPGLAAFNSSLFAHARYTMAQPPSYPYFFVGQTEYLFTLRWARDVMLTNALAHHLRPNAADTSFRDRALSEALAVCTNFTTSWGSPGWGTTWRMHLDISETMHGVALAYDWLYQDMSTENRTTLANCLVYVLARAYRGNITAPYTPAIPRGMFWVNSSSNWGCVSAAGPIAAILALFGEAEDPGWLWDEVLRPAVTSATTCFAAFQPDSSWTEG